MNMITDTILAESKSARSNQLAQIDEEQATEILNKIKALYFALWKGKNTRTLAQIFCGILKSYFDFAFCQLK